MKKTTAYKIIGILIILVFSILISTDYINNVQHTMIDYDGGYNATVAANFARYGEYRVSYPSDIIFYNLITTGETVVLPTALLYKIFGINYLTSYIIPIVYSLCVVWLLYFFITSCLNKKNSAVNVVAALAVVYLVLSDSLYYYISTHLIGEIAALFFLLITFEGLFKYLETGKNYNLVIAGAALIAAFLTKSSMIFVVVSLIGILLFEMLVTKSIKSKGFLNFMLGVLIGWLILESFKMWQLRGVANYVNWWSDEWSNMMNQSSGIDTTYSVWDKFVYLETIFGGCNKYFCAVMLLLPILVYIILWIYRMKNKDFKSNGLLTMSISGICGASLIIYFVLLGGSGLVYARRHEVNEILVRVYIIFFLIFVTTKLIGRALEEKAIPKIIFACLGVILSITLIPMICPWGNVKANWETYINKQDDDYYSTALMKEFIDEITDLPEDATLYTAGWWQEPNVTLFLDKDMTSIYDVIYGGSELAEDSYFISGSLINKVNLSDLENGINANLIRVDTSETDYSLYNSGFDRENIENFAIYKVEPVDYPLCITGTVLYFNEESDNGRSYVKSGLSRAESGFSWTDGSETTFEMTMEGKETSYYTCELQIGGVFNGSQQLTIIANGSEVFSDTITADKAIEFAIENNNEGKVDIVLELPDATSPYSLGIGEDIRELGIMIKQLTISE